MLKKGSREVEEDEDEILYQKKTEDLTTSRLVIEGFLRYLANTYPLFAYFFVETPRGGSSDRKNIMLAENKIIKIAEKVKNGEHITDLLNIKLENITELKHLIRELKTIYSLISNVRFTKASYMFIAGTCVLTRNYHNGSFIFDCDRFISPFDVDSNSLHNNFDFNFKVGGRAFRNMLDYFDVEKINQFSERLELENENNVLIDTDNNKDVNKTRNLCNKFISYVRCILRF